MTELLELEARLEQLLLTLRENAGALPAHMGLEFATVALGLARALRAEMGAHHLERPFQHKALAAWAKLLRSLEP